MILFEHRDTTDATPFFLFVLTCCFERCSFSRMRSININDEIEVCARVLMRMLEKLKMDVYDQCVICQNM